MVLVPVHRHALALPAELAVGRRANGSAAVALDLCAALLERQKLLGAEGLVVDLRGRLNQVLEVRAREEIAQVNEFAVLVVFDVDGAPSVLAAADGLAVDVNVALRADNREGDDGLGGSQC